MVKLYFIFLMFLVPIFISCKKEPVVITTLTTEQQPPTPPPPSPPLDPLNTAPNVFAGSDIYIVFPADSCSLKGSAQYPESIKNTLWNKISGPTLLVLENPNAYETKLRNLEKGIYEVEFIVTNNAGLTGRDTVSVFVLEAVSGENEIIIKDLQWVCPMGCHMRIENLQSLIPTGTAFKVYVKRDNSTQWIEVVNMSQGTGKYVWTIYNNGLEILEDQTEFPNDTPDVKITF